MQRNHRYRRRNPPHQGGGRRLRRAGRRAVQPVSARARPDAAVPRIRRAGGDRRISRLGMHLDASGAPRRHPGGRRSRGHTLCGRIRRAHGGASPRHRWWHAKAGLQFPARHAGDGRSDFPHPAARDRNARRWALHKLRRWTRLPVPMLVLHHHQRARAQVSLPNGRRRGGNRACQRGTGRHPLLRHRRQLRAEQELGADPRPAHRAPRGRGLQDSPAPAGRHALPSNPRLHREGGAGWLQHGLHRA